MLSHTFVCSLTSFIGKLCLIRCDQRDVVGSHSNHQIVLTNRQIVLPVLEVSPWGNQGLSPRAFLGLLYTVSGRYLTFVSAFPIIFVLQVAWTVSLLPGSWRVEHTLKKWKCPSVGTFYVITHRIRGSVPQMMVMTSYVIIIDGTWRISQFFWSSPRQNAFGNYCENHNVHMLLLSICISVSLKVSAPIEPFVALSLKLFIPPTLKPIFTLKFKSRIRWCSREDIFFWKSCHPVLNLDDRHQCHSVQLHFAL